MQDLIERLAREADLSEIKALDFRREMNQEMTSPELTNWNGVVRFARLYADEIAKEYEGSLLLRGGREIAEYIGSKFGSKG